MIGALKLGRMQSPYNDLAEVLGYGLGSGLGSLYENSQKPGKIQELMELYNLDEKQAAALYNQPPEIQQQFLQNMQKQQQRQQSMHTLGNLMSRLGNGDGGIPNEAQALLESAGLDRPEQQIFNQYLKSSQRERQHQEKLSLREKEMLQKEEDRVSKFNKPYVDELYKDYKTAKHESAVLDQMKEASKTGKFSHPARQALQDFFGTDIDLLRTDDDIIWRKLQNEFLPKMKSLFGGKVSDKEMAQFMKGVPSLTQSQEGREKLIDMLKLYTKIPRERYKAYKELSKKYSGRDLRERVDDASEKRIDAITNQIIKKTGMRTISDEEAFNKSGKQKLPSFEESIFNLAKQQIEPENKQVAPELQVGQIFESASALPSYNEPYLVRNKDTGELFYNVNGELIPEEEFK